MLNFMVRMAQKAIKSDVKPLTDCRSPGTGLPFQTTLSRRAYGADGLGVLYPR
jgi:hypothetical protein